jgi:hypothetical protein
MDFERSCFVKSIFGYFLIVSPRRIILAIYGSTAMSSTMVIRTLAQHYSGCSWLLFADILVYVALLLRLKIKLWENFCVYFLGSWFGFIRLP